MKMKRKSIMILTTLTLVTLMLVGATLAYLTDSRQTLNILGIGIGNKPEEEDKENPNNLMVLIKLTEDEFVAAAKAQNEKNVTAMRPGTDDEYSVVKLMGIYPNQRVNKDSKITNIGLGDVYVRVKLVDETGNPIDLNDATFQKHIKAAIGDKWVKMGDYYYYSVDGTNHAKLTAKTKTAAAGTVNVFKEEYFDKVNKTGPYTIYIPETANNETAAKVVQLNVIAEAIQATDFEPGALVANGTGNPWKYSKEAGGGNVEIETAVNRTK